MSGVDTIAAIATPLGRGGIGIVRISGPAVSAIARTLIGDSPPPRSACYRRFLDRSGAVIDTGIALYFSQPHSYTGEDVLELQAHGGRVVLDMLLSRVLELGARPARPGEFSERAFLNDKIDLAQAEAVADLIDSQTVAAARSAQRSLQGDFSKRVGMILEALIELRAWIEGAIDFPEEEIDFLSEHGVQERLENILEKVQEIVASAERGVLLKEGVTAVIAGRPNVGKSSLLNRLAARETAIVTEIPGTTRDLLREHIQLDGLPLHVVDTAGLRVAADSVEREGIERAWSAIGQADLILLVVDDRFGIEDQETEILASLPSGPVPVVVRNKIDLSGTPPQVRTTAHGVQIGLSALTGSGMELLIEHLKASVGFAESGEHTFLARRRHVDALERSRDALLSARTSLADLRAGELVAEDLRQAQNALGEITGEFRSDDLLDRIFSSFCIGK